MSTTSDSILQHFSDVARISTFRKELWPIDSEFSKSRSQLIGGRLSAPPTSRHAVSSYSTSWDDLRENPADIFSANQDGNIPFTIPPNGDVAHQLDLDGLFVKRSSTKLLVILHGALDREKYSLPRFEYQRALKDFDGSILFLQDPTLYVHDKLTLGWYIGTEKDNGHSMAEELIKQAVKALGPKQLVIAGSSGGGFAALAISARIPSSSALVFSPQTSVEKYNTNHRRRFISSAFPSLDPSVDSLIALEDRFDMGALYAKGTTNKIFYLQNTGDPFHMKNHCIPFMQHAGLNLLDGEMRNERIKVECRYLSEGHRGPRPHQLRMYVNRVFDGGF